MGISIIKNRIKEYEKLIYINPNYFATLRALWEDKESKIVLFGTPAHGNLGDQAIAISELDFLRKTSEGRRIIEIPMPLYKTHRNVIKSRIGNHDTIVISGGGWMGNLWIHNEITIREIVADYLGNRVVIFPQTLYYSKDESGRQALAETKEIFSRHRNLVLAVRDKDSFSCAKSQLGLVDGKSLVFCPDMAIYGTLAQKPINQSGERVALVCFRGDIEKMGDHSGIKDQLAKEGFLVRETTTVLGHLIPIKRRGQIVANKIQEFGGASIIITDRLHAMIFAALSGTPCIAFNNATGKVFGVGEYLKKSDVELFLADKAELPAIDWLHLKKKEFFLTDELKTFFSKLASKVNGQE